MRSTGSCAVHSCTRARVQTHVWRSAMQRCTPLQVFQPTADQRLSSRKITCKAFPFVVEKQRVTSYLLLVKKHDVPWETLWICTSFFLYLRVDVETWIARRGLSLGFKTVCCWGALSEITVERGSRWNKKVNLLLVCFAGYECFCLRFLLLTVCGS